MPNRRPLDFQLLGAKADAAPADQRALLYLGALFATTHLQKLCPLSSERASKGHALTPRELSVLRSLSLGYRAAQISKDLGIGEETIRSHIKKAQAKLGVNNTVEAVSKLYGCGRFHSLKLAHH